MLKKILGLLSFFVILPSFAGAFEDAIKSNDYVFLYLYTSNCGYCTKFTPIYEQLKKSHKEIKFLKVDADTLYGFNLMRNFGARYVPFVALVNSKTKMGEQISPECIMQLACTEKAIKGFKK